VAALTAHAESILPRLQQVWIATEAAARTIDDELGFSLPDTIERTLTLLDRLGFAERLRTASRQGAQVKVPK
jgi:hypothetical protein